MGAVRRSRAVRLTPPELIDQQVRAGESTLLTVSPPDAKAYDGSRTASTAARRP